MLIAVGFALSLSAGHPRAARGGVIWISDTRSTQVTFNLTDKAQSPPTHFSRVDYNTSGPGNFSLYTASFAKPFVPGVDVSQSSQVLALNRILAALHWNDNTFNGISTFQEFTGKTDLNFRFQLTEPMKLTGTSFHAGGPSIATLTSDGGGPVALFTPFVPTLNLSTGGGGGSFSTINLDVTLSPVPEPTGMGATALALVLLTSARRRWCV
jgi:hypothetical protein